MRPTFPLYSIPLLVLTALAPSQAQASSDLSAQQQQVLDDAAAVLATLQDQTPKDITALQALASNGIFGGNARLASENSLLIAILGRIPQLAQDLSAALDQTNVPAPAPPATITPPPTPISIPVSTPKSTPIAPPSQDPAILKKRCDILQTQLKAFTVIKKQANGIARATDGGASLFYTASKFIQTESRCQGDPSEACKSLNDLVAQFQVAGDQVLREARKHSTPNTSIHNNAEVLISNIAKVIDMVAPALLATITRIRTSLQCS